jgi:cyclophilin family peptidyl-prolyl cis-trans isomerase
MKMALFHLFGNSKQARRQKNSPQHAQRSRRARVEALEPRTLLTTLSLLNVPSGGLTVTAGSSLMFALNGSGGSNLTFSASSGNSSQVAASVTPATNETLQLTVTANTSSTAISSTNPGTVISGTMDFQLFDNYAGVGAITSHIESLVGQSFYNNLQFFRIINGVLQAGSPTNNGQGGSGASGAIGTTYDDAYSPDLQFSTGGVLAMAKSANDGNDSQFFITSSAVAAYNYRYSIVGFETQGSSFEQQLSTLPVETSTNFSGEDSQPVNTVTITSASIITDKQNGVLILNAPSTATAGQTETVNVTVGDGTAADTVVVPITVTIAANTSTTLSNPYLGTIPAINTVAGKSVTVTSIPAINPGSGTMYYNYGLSGDNNSTVTAFNNNTGQFTIQPTAGFVGMTPILLAVCNSAADTTSIGSYDTQVVPMFVTPTAPSISVSGVSAAGYLNVDTGFTFTVSGLFEGTDVTIFANGQELYSTPSTAASMTITTPSGTTLSDGVYTFTASQTDSLVDVTAGNQSITKDLVSPLSTGEQVTLNTTATAVTLPSGQGAATKFTLRRLGANAELVTDSSGKVLWTVPTASVVGLNVIGVANTAEQLTVDLNVGGVFAFKTGVAFTAGAGVSNDVLIVRGNNAGNTFNLSSAGLVVGGMDLTFTGVSPLRLHGGTGNDDYILPSSATNVAITDPGGNNTLDFSGDSKGITLNLALNSGQAQSIAPWGKTLSLQGTFQDLIGTPYADTLTGNGAADILTSNGGNDVLRAGSGNTVLVGGSGNSTLYAGSGTCLLIAGSGTSTLYGGSGVSLLVGGSTSYDANDQALLSILGSEGTQLMAMLRVRPLLSSVGAGSDVLKMGATAHDSGVKDILVAGKGHTWFLPGAHSIVKQ